MTRPDETPVRPLGSIAELQKGHAELLREVDDPPEEEDLGKVATFLLRAAATGASLDTPEDRRQAQGLIDYWVATLQSRPRTADGLARTKEKPVLLAEFDTTTLDDACQAAERWLATLPEDDLRTVRRILLRLVRLDKDSNPVLYYGPDAMFDDLEPTSRTREIVDKLRELGVVRLTSSPSGGPQIGLRSDTMMVKWNRLGDWLKERLRFREEANRWLEESGAKPTFAKSAVRFVKRQLVSIGKRLEWLGGIAAWLFRRSIPQGSSGEVFEDGPFYRDKNQAELSYVHHTTVQAREERDSSRVIWAFLAVLLLGGVVYLATMMGLTLAREMERTQELEKRRNRQRLKELVAVVRLLATYSVFSSADRPNPGNAEIARWRCNDLVQSLLNEEQQKEYRQDLAAIGIETEEKDICVECASLVGVQAIAKKLHELIETRAGEDRDTKRYLAFLRHLNTQTLKRLIDELANAYGDNEAGRISTTDATPYLDEFLILKSGETAVVHDARVLDAMGAFADQLHCIGELAVTSVRTQVPLELRDPSRGEKTLPGKPTPWQRLNLYKPKGGKQDGLKILLATPGVAALPKAEIDKLRKSKADLLAELTASQSLREHLADLHGRLP